MREGEERREGGRGYRKNKRDVHRGIEIMERLREGEKEEKFSMVKVGRNREG